MSHLGIQMTGKRARLIFSASRLAMRCPIRAYQVATCPRVGGAWAHCIRRVRSVATRFPK